MWDSDEALANVAYFPRGGNHGDTSGSGKWFFLYHGMHKAGESLWAHGKGGAWSLVERGQSVFVPDGKHFILDSCSSPPKESTRGRIIWIAVWSRGTTTACSS